VQYEARAEREARDTRTGLAAEPLVLFKNPEGLCFGGSAKLGVI